MKECTCKKPSEFTRLSVRFKGKGKKRYLVETCMNCDGIVPEKNNKWLFYFSAAAILSLIALSL